MNGENKELKDEIIQLGTRYGIVTPYTSFLVTEDMKDIGMRHDMPAAQRRRMNEMAKAAPPAGSAGGAMSTGQAAVDFTLAVRELKESNGAGTPESYSTSIRTVGDKTFRLQSEEWIDTEFKASSAMPTLEVQFGSEEFFNLIAKEPRLAEFFSLGKRVTVVFRGKVYRVTS